MLRITQIFPVAIAFVGVTLCSLTAVAQLPTPDLTRIYPLGAKRGSSIDVTVTGGNIEDLRQMLFSHPGIKAKQKMGAKGEFDKFPKPVNNQFTVTVGPKVPTGVYEVRVVGRYGVSNPRAFMIGNLNEVNDDGSNKTIDKAKEIKVGTTINGTVDASARDYYKFNVTKGQRVVIECWGQRIDSRADNTLILYSEKGQELKRNRNSLGNDPLIDFTAKAAGTFIVGVRDSTYRGGADYTYRLSIHSQPYVDYVFPPCGIPGSTGMYALFGRNLPGGKIVPGATVGGQPLEQIQVQIKVPNGREDRTASGTFLTSNSVWLDGVEFSHANSNPVRIGFASAKVITETGANNDDSTKAQKVTVPCEFAGRFFPKRDIDWIEFQGKANEVYRIEVISEQEGRTTDPVMLIQQVTKDKDGKETARQVTYLDDGGGRNGRIGAEFDTTTDDPSSYRLATNNGIYRIMVRDQLGDARSDHRSLYRIKIRKEKQDFRLIAIPKQLKVANGNQILQYSPALRRGGTMILGIELQRRDGFSGPVEVKVEGLPKGVSCPPVTLDTNKSSIPLVFSATENADIWSGKIRIVGTAQIGGKAVSREARGLTVVWSTGNKTQTAAECRATQDIVLAVGEDKDPIFAQAGDGKLIQTARGGQVKIPLNVTRRNGYAGNLKFVATGLPKELKPGDITLNGKTNKGTISLNVTNKAAKPGIYTFYLRCDSKVKYSRNLDAIRRAEEQQKHVAAIIKQLTADVKAATAAKAKKKLADLQAKLKRAQAAKKAADGALAGAKKSYAMKDINLMLISTPVRFRVNPSAVKVAAAKSTTIKAGAKVQVPVTITRMYGFNDVVNVTVALPKNSGLTAAKLTVAKGKNTGTLTLTANAKAKPGTHNVTLTATGSYNKIANSASQQVAVKITK